MAYTAERTWVTGEKVTAAQLNEQIRDNMIAGFPTDAVFTAWSPTYNGITVGNGTVVARYIQIGKLIVCYFELLLGSTSSVGTGPTVSTPVAASASYTASENRVGDARLLDSGTANYPAAIRIASASTFGIDVMGAASTYVNLANITATVPFTWATSDRLFFQAAYEAA